jgi:hypothetical protein
MKRDVQFLAVFLLLVLALTGCPQPAGDGSDQDDKLDASWFVAATPFMLKDGTAVTNVKLTWPKRAGATRYEVYRDGSFLGNFSGDTADDYDLAPDRTYQYYVKAFFGKTLTATSAAVTAATFTPPEEGPHRIYTNSTASWSTLIESPASPAGWKFGDTWYNYRISGSGTLNIQVNKSYDDGETWQGWTTLTTVGTYVDPDTGQNYSVTGAKLEGAVFHRVGDKVVLTAHREPGGSSYALGHFFLASCYPFLNRAEVTFDARPFGCDSRDQSVFVDDDGTAYVLSSGLGDSYFFRLNKDWTEPVEHVNTVFVGTYRETPHIMHVGDTYFFYGSRQNGWYPSQTEYSTAASLGGEWGPLTQVGNTVTNGSQFNRVEEYGSERKTYGLWGYRWAANWTEGSNYSQENANVQRLSVLTINGDFSASEYFSQIAWYPDWGLVGIQPGRYLSLGAPVTVSTLGEGVNANPAFITDGGDMSNSGYFKGNGYPYDAEIDLGAPAVLREINLTVYHYPTGSDSAVHYLYAGSEDGETWTTLADQSANHKPGFTMDEITDPTPYRYLKITVYGATNVRNGSSANWAEGIIELAVFGTPQ